MSNDKRHFHRIDLQGDVTITHGDASVHADLLDLSLKGALTAHPVGWTPSRDEHCELAIRLESADTVINMDCRVAHIEPDRIGFHCQHIDIDSVSFLKRLVELNLGDPALLERELSALG